MVGLFLFVPFVLGWSFSSREHWSKRRVMLVAASPPAGLVALPCIALIGITLATPSEKCGVDACGMALYASLYGLGFALLGFMAGLLMAAIGVYAAYRRKKPSAEADIFK